MKEAILEPLLRKMRLARVLPYIQSFANPKVLDIGCGWEARLLREIEPYISKGVGIDFKAPKISTPKLETFAYFFEQKEEITESSQNAFTFNGGGGDANLSTKHCHLPFENEEFDVVTLLAVLEHLNHPKEMLQEIARVLKPNGILLLTVPSRAAKPVLEFLSYRLKIVSEAEIRDHKRYYNKADLANLAHQVPNLCLQKHKYFQCGMNNFALLRKVQA